MTITASVANQPSSGVDTTLKPFDQTKFAVRKDSVLDKSTGEIMSEYVFTDGSTSDETVVTVRSTPQRDGSISHSIKVVSRYLEIDDSGTPDVVLVDVPISVTLAWASPALSRDPGVILEFILSCITLVYNGVTTKVPNEGLIGKLQRSITGSLYG